MCVCVACVVYGGWMCNSFVGARQRRRYLRPWGHLHWCVCGIVFLGLNESQFKLNISQLNCLVLFLHLFIQFFCKKYF